MPVSGRQPMRILPRHGYRAQAERVPGQRLRDFGHHGIQRFIEPRRATAEDADPSIQPADGVSLSGASGVAHSALALAASAAALVALA